MYKMTKKKKRISEKNDVYKFKKVTVIPKQMKV